MSRTASKGEGPKSPLSSCWSFDDLEFTDKPSETEISLKLSMSSSGDKTHFDILFDPLKPSLQLTKSQEPSELDQYFIASVEGSFSRTIEATRPELIRRYVKAMEKDNSKSSDPSLSQCILHLDPKAPSNRLVFDSDEKDLWESALKYFSKRSTNEWKRMLSDTVSLNIKR
ncbi:hypothetical protein I203_101073 [Kwoniella mangroviensis CBS 8507]|uniref:uncharacterized protein n=1 Tax=Kwoniella mangroviensis CBS 8507 TaxID=1296122 RepID=UPI00080D0AB1|nr:uncharacterized protein I203_02709 [Kwoniella mangroviensis CBS 8507]OCF68050.1 hypothetical protein I203_02709 [Kwoniella mangroviensis CBS 8507]